MMRRALRFSFVVAVNLAVLSFMLGGIEIYFRYLHRPQPQADGAIFGLEFAPYTMFMIGGKGSHPVTWRDIFANRDIPAVHDRNNLGFRADDDFDMAASHSRKENERIVVITGGSAVHGVGATSSQANLSGVMETILNESQTNYRYRVINMGFGNAIAFQQYITLALYGRWYDPDWIIAMDGWNDIAVACAHSQGAGYPMHYHAMRSYVDGYLKGQRQPSFYRGEWENELIRASAAYRSLTGKQYVPREQHIYTGEGFPRIGVEATWADIERQVKFYLHSQELILGLSSRARYILSQQPMALAYTDLIQPEDELHEAEQNHGSESCGVNTFYNGGLAYFATRTEQGLQAMVQAHAPTGFATYVNMNDLFPADHASRRGFLIDNMHLNDRGHRIVGSYYAGRILAADFPAEAGRHMARMKAGIEDTLGQPLPDHSAMRERIAASRTGVTTPQKDRIRILEASYGLNCKGFKVPAGMANTARQGNATAALRKACNHAQICQYDIDVQQLGDPANSCGKDFSVSWNCNDGRDDRRISLPGEAHGKSVQLTCPAQ